MEPILYFPDIERLMRWHTFYIQRSKDKYRVTSHFVFRRSEVMLTCDDVDRFFVGFCWPKKMDVDRNDEGLKFDVFPLFFVTTISL